MGFEGSNPGSASTFDPTLKKVSPILAYLTCFMLLMAYPICPGFSYY
jgi:hypothetical protein